jgi:UDP-glucose 4-epimerase
MNILDPEFSSNVEEFRPEAIVHLAAQASVSESLRDPERDWAVNAQGTRIIAEAALATGATRVISASSAAVYGEPAETDLPLLETAPKAPANPYGKSKLAAEGMLAEVLLGTNVDFASFRFSNVYGPRQDAEGEGGVVALFAAALAEQRPPRIYGSGDQTRDFIYVADVVGAITSALVADTRLAQDAGDASAYNVSTGLETSVNELFVAMRRASDYEGEAERAAAREGDVVRSSLDPHKAARTFGWQAHQTLELGTRMTWRWFAANR